MVGSRVARHPITPIIVDGIRCYHVDDAGIELIKDGNQRFCSDIPQLHRPLLSTCTPIISTPRSLLLYPSRKTNAHLTTHAAITTILLPRIRARGHFAYFPYSAANELLDSTKYGGSTGMSSNIFGCGIVSVVIYYLCWSFHIHIPICIL